MLNDHTALTTKTYTAGANPIGAGYSIATMAPYNSDTNFSVTITAISATEIKGSFSGKVKDEAGVIVDISEGLFSAKIH